MATVMVMSACVPGDDVRSRRPQTVDEAEHILVTLGKSAELTADDLLELDREAAFFAVLRHAATQPVVHTRSVLHREDPEPDLENPTHGQDVEDVWFDYRTKKWARASDRYGGGRPDPEVIWISPGKLVEVYRCVDGREYSFSTRQNENPDNSWQRTDLIICDPQNVMHDVNDGINAGGLDGEQADVFVEAIRKRDVMSVYGLRMAERGGKQYLRFAVRMHASTRTSPALPGLSDCAGGHPGGQGLESAFNETGLNSALHPYQPWGCQYRPGGAFVYYVDPKTRLPVYLDGVAGTAEQTQHNNTKIKTRRWRVEHRFNDPRPAWKLERPSAPSRMPPMKMTWPMEDFDAP